MYVSVLKQSTYQDHNNRNHNKKSYRICVYLCMAQINYAMFLNTIKGKIYCCLTVPKKHIRNLCFCWCRLLLWLPPFSQFRCGCNVHISVWIAYASFFVVVFFSTSTIACVARVTTHSGMRIQHTSKKMQQQQQPPPPIVDTSRNPIVGIPKQVRVVCVWKMTMTKRKKKHKCNPAGRDGSEFAHVQPALHAVQCVWRKRNLLTIFRSIEKATGIEMPCQLGIRRGLASHTFFSAFVFILEMRAIEEWRKKKQIQTHSRALIDWLIDMKIWVLHGNQYGQYYTCIFIRLNAAQCAVCEVVLPLHCHWLEWTMCDGGPTNFNVYLQCFTKIAVLVWKLSRSDANNLVGRASVCSLKWTI